MYVKTASYQDANAAKQFCDSLRETGFGVVTDHPIDPKLVEEVFSEWQAFFATEDKRDYLFNKDTQDGLFPIDISETAKGFEQKDIKEFFHYYPWGQHPKNMSDKTQRLYEQMNQLATTILNWVEAQTPVEISQHFSTSLSSMIDKSDMTLLRIIHYPPFSGSEEPGSVRAAAHEDIDLITLLPAATAKGLEVQDVHGNWHEVPCEPGSIVVNTGDMLQECTQGYYPATTHRVINPEGEDRSQGRLSMPLFLHPRPDVVLSSRYTADSYLQERLQELGVK